MRSFLLQYSTCLKQKDIKKYIRYFKLVKQIVNKINAI